jgi:hypothetical protein
VVKPADDTLKCLSKATVVEQCRFVTSTRPGPEAEAMRALAKEDPKVVSVDLDHLVCPYLPICDPVVDGLVVKRDGNHLTVKFGRHLQDPFTEILRDHGILRR